MIIPKYTGTFAVGCVDLMTKARKIPTDLLCPFSLCDDSTDLGSFARVFYPCKTSKGYKKASWFPEENRNIYIKGVLNNNGIGWLSPLVKFASRNVYSHSFSNPPIVNPAEWQDIQVHSYLKDKKSMPLVIFSHGLSLSRFMYTAFCTQLASEGFIVAAIEHRDGSACGTFVHDETDNVVEIPYFPFDDESEEKTTPRNVQVNRRCMEVGNLLNVLEKLNEEPENITNVLKNTFDLNTLKGRIDTTKPLIIGHSFGGTTTVNVLHKDDRFKCGIGLDIWFPKLGKEIYEKDYGFKKSLLVLYTEFFKKNLKTTYNYIDNQPTGFVEMVTLKGGVHMHQCDVPGVTPWFLLKGANQPERVNDYDVSVDAQRKMIMNYFGKYLEREEYPVKISNDDLPKQIMLGCPKLYNEEEDSAKNSQKKYSSL